MVVMHLSTSFQQAFRTLTMSVESAVSGAWSGQSKVQMHKGIQVDD
jgi:hypothetical protein